MKVGFGFRLFLGLGFLSLPVQADVNFEELSCYGGQGLSTRVFSAKVQDSELVFNYESSDMHRLLEAIFPEGTPSELSGLYRCMELELSIPVTRCMHASRNLELVTCEAENVRMSITAKNSCYKPTKTKVYTGEATKFAFATKKTTKDKTNYIEHHWGFTIKGKNEVVDFTDSYIANFWQAESGIGRPACRVDDYVIDYRK